MTCPQCKDAARFLGYRWKTIVSLVGPIRIARGYYHCPHCQAGRFPWDELLRLSPRMMTVVR